MTDGYKVLDTETSIRNIGPDSIGSHSASPYHPRNRIVWEGVLDSDGHYADYHYNYDHAT